MTVRSPCSEHPISLKLDSLGMRYNKKRKTKKNLENKTFFIENYIFQKSKFFQKVTFSKKRLFENWLLWKNVTFWKFLIFEKCHRIFFKKNFVFLLRFFIFSFYYISSPSCPILSFWLLHIHFWSQLMCQAFYKKTKKYKFRVNRTNRIAISLDFPHG